MPKKKIALPGYTHANIVGQRNDGSDGCGKLGLRAEVVVFMVSIANNKSDYYQRKQVCRVRRLKENKWMDQYCIVTYITLVG